jgi:hypothetical protein
MRRHSSRPTGRQAATNGEHLWWVYLLATRKLVRSAVNELVNRRRRRWRSLQQLALHRAAEIYFWKLEYRS